MSWEETGHGTELRHVTEAEIHMAQDILDSEMAVPYPNPSGLRPVEFKILILPISVEERTAGGIIKPDITRDQEKYSRMRGRLIACSPLAFSYATEAEWQGQKPKAGDLVIYAKFAGANEKGPKDGVEYTIANDKDVLMVIEE